MNRNKSFCDVSTSKTKHNCHTNIFLGLITVILVSSSKETYLSSGVIELLRHEKFRQQGRKLMYLFSITGSLFSYETRRKSFQGKSNKVVTCLKQ